MKTKRNPNSLTNRNEHAVQRLDSVRNMFSDFELNIQDNFCCHHFPFGTTNIEKRVKPFGFNGLFWSLSHYFLKSVSHQAFRLDCATYSPALFDGMWFQWAIRCNRILKKYLILLQRDQGPCLQHLSVYYVQFNSSCLRSNLN